MKRLTRIKSKISDNKKVFGFDIETYGQKNDFLMGSLFSNDVYEDKPYIFVFWNKHEFLKEIKTRKFRNAYIVATNLSFDFFGVFFNNIEISNFRFSFRGSQLIGMKSYIIDDEFHCKSYYIDDDGIKKCSKHCLHFIDTINYVFYSVKKLGQIVGVDKLPSPACLGKKPKNKKEKDELIKYNIRDSEISYLFIKFLFSSLIQLGGKPKMTIASSTMDVFRRVYLNDTFYVHDKEVIREQLNAYYGGRTESFKQGYFKNYNYYDFCSLYPTVMLKGVPDPNTLHVATGFNSLEFINNYEGVSHVRVKTPSNLYYPVLPVRTKEKLLFPLGSFSGWYTHVELRKAISEGYEIQEVYKTYWYERIVKVFNNFVNDLYAKRLIEKKKGNPIQLVYKLLLNSLYGKFAQKLENDIIQPFNFEINELVKNKEFERLGNFVRIVSENEPSCFNIVIWSIYITAYARLMLYDKMKELKPIYVDTDSLITKKTIHSGLNLGDLELEYIIKDGFIVKPKFYGFRYLKDGKINQVVKVKGISEQLKFDEFYNRIKNSSNNKVTFNYNKFCKFREAIRRGLVPNEILKISKNLELIDNKRTFKKFNINGLNDSRPLILDL